MALAHHCAVFTCTYYLVDVILFNKQHFQIKKQFATCVVQYQRLGTFILSLLCSNMNCSFIALRHCHVWCVTVLRLPLFAYYLAHCQMVSYILNSIFKLKETICNMYSIIPEAWNIQDRYGKLESGSPWEVQKFLQIIHKISGVQIVAVDQVRPTEKSGSSAPMPRSWKVAESIYKYMQRHWSSQTVYY